VNRGEGGSWVVVGTDGSDRARAAVDVAIAVARANGVGIHVVYAYVVPSSCGFSPELMPHLDPRAEMERVLSDASQCARAGGVPVKTHAVRGDPADALIRLADSEAASVIVVGNKGMAARRRFLLGNVPEKVSHHARCNVLIAHTG
jgi:nucleotide-binding universal stress UspA family protein